MNTTSQPRPHASAFTLVELLTVISIIAILMGLLFPAIGVVKESARKTQAKTDVTNIVAAVKQYYTEYGKYPPVQAAGDSGSTSTDISVGDPDAGATLNNNALFNTLRAIPDGVNEQHKLNARRIVFFEGKGVTTPESPRGGFLDNGSGDKKGCFFDPWGKQYTVVMDSNYDNVIDLQGQYTDFTTPNQPRVGAAAYSMGKDNKLGDKGNKQYKKGTTQSDDVISWQ